MYAERLGMDACGKQSNLGSLQGDGYEERRVCGRQWHRRGKPQEPANSRRPEDRASEEQELRPVPLGG